MNIFLKPGALYISEKPAIVSTILGSCIAVTIFNKRLKVGGICHALLPKK
jgi:chemotaxis protein CheD